MRIVKLSCDDFLTDAMDIRQQNRPLPLFRLIRRNWEGHNENQCIGPANSAER